MLTAEGIAFEEPALAQLAKAASGSLRDSLSLLDQAIAHGGGKVTAAQVAEMLGSLGGDLVWPLLERIAAGDGKGTIAEAERIASRSISFDTALEDLAAILHRIALAQAGAAPADDDPDAQRVAGMAQRLDAGRVQVMYQIALLGRRDLSLAPDEFAGFTMALLRMLSFADLRRSRARCRGRCATSRAPAAPRRRRRRLLSRRVRAPAPRLPARNAEPAAFDDDWPGLVERLQLTGMARMAARHAELASFQDNHLELVVPETHRMYAEKPYLDKLKAELAPHFGPGLRLARARGGPRGHEPGGGEVARDGRAPGERRGSDRGRSLRARAGARSRRGSGVFVHSPGRRGAGQTIERQEVTT